MGLLDKLNNGVTSLKSIPFGGDQPGGGNSKQPYIRKSIDEKQHNPAYNNEYLVRGGIEAPLSAAEDVVRLTKYFLDVQNPQGLLFVAKQELLSRTGTKTEASKGLGYAGGALNEGVYNPLSTLAQAGVGFAGIHLNKQGIDPTGLIPGLGINKYQDIIARDQLTKGIFTGRVDVNDNRLVRLTDAITRNRGVNNFNGVVGYSLNPSIENDVLISYGGGPDSILGIGKTKIRFATDVLGNPIRTLDKKPKDYLVGQPYEHVDQEKFQLPINASSTYNNLIKEFSTDYVPYNLIKNGLRSYQENIIISVYESGSLKSNSNIGVGSWTQQDFIDQPLDLDTDIKDDFREKLDINAGNTFLSATKGYKDNNIEDKFGMGNPGSRQRNRSNPFSGSILPGQTTSEPLDKVTAYPIYKLNSNKPAKYGTDTDLNDLVQFSIAILNNDNQNDEKATTPTNYTYKKYMHFRAFIDNISDSYNADWNTIEYMGRAEKFYKYGGFSRKMGLSFTVVAQSKDELNVMYDKLNFLASSLAPEYLDSSSSGYMAGNIAYITLGDYINDQPGVITGVDFDIPEDSPWEINRDGKSLRQLPHMIKVKVDFIPIQKFRPEKQSWRNHGLGNVESELLMDPGNQRFIDDNNPYNTRGTRYAPTQDFATDSLNSPTQVPIQTQQAQNVISTTSVANSDPSLEPGGAIGLVM
jgi:hypothetical protein